MTLVGRALSRILEKLLRSAVDYRLRGGVAEKCIDNCTYIVHVAGMEFEWDDTKCSENIRARGLDFQDAIPAFFDSDRKIWEDDRKDYGEVRYNMLAESNNRIFAVTFTIRNGVVRIISFRKANKRETRKYGQL